MNSRVDTFTNNDGQIVYAAFADVKLDDGRTISRHQGTFAAKAEADRRIEDVRSGKPERWEEPE